MSIHPYIPNSEPETKRQMLREIGVRNVEELFAVIPERAQFKKALNLPEPISEHQLMKRVKAILSKNKTSGEIVSFLGAGCWPHYVPAACDEINSRSEFLTAYTGDVYSDLGRFQALFEFQSMIGELVGLDAVTFPTYDWPTAAGDAVRMAAIATGRCEVLVPRTISSDRLSVIRGFCRRLSSIDYDRNTGQLDLEDMRKKLSSDTAAIYVENPTYLGFIETQLEDIGEIAHKNGTLLIVGVEPLSLGVLTPPGEVGADIVCGEGQPLGLHMNFGGALSGFLACRDEVRFLEATGHRLITITKTRRKGELGFAYVLPERSMFSSREKSASITGTGTALWAITAAIYLALLGPKGIQELAEVIMQKAHYAMRRMAKLKGVRVPLFASTHFEEFTVNFDGIGKTVREVNKALLKRGIQGGKDISKEFPELGNTALYCVTEVHSMEDIDSLIEALGEIAGQ
jgi:glycine cleavage system P protein (glycine dehydrogenase) subunit 1